MTKGIPRKVSEGDDVWSQVFPSLQSGYKYTTKMERVWGATHTIFSSFCRLFDRLTGAQSRGVIYGTPCGADHTRSHIASVSNSDGTFFRYGKMTYFRFSIITVLLLRMQIQREVLLKVLTFFALRSVSVLIKPHRSIRAFLHRGLKKITPPPFLSAAVLTMSSMHCRGGMEFPSLKD